MSSKARLLPGTGAPYDPWFLSSEAALQDHDPVAEDHVPAVSAEDTAFARGVAEGRRLAATEAAAELDQMKSALWSALASAADARTRVLTQAHHQLVEVAVAMARHIVRRHAEYETAVVATMAEAAIKSLQGSGGLRVCLNPLDHARLVAAGDSSHAAATWTADPAVERGGCRVISTFGEIDAGVDAQLAELSLALFDDNNDIPPAP